MVWYPLQLKFGAEYATEKAGSFDDIHESWCGLHLLGGGVDVVGCADAASSIESAESVLIVRKNCDLGHLLLKWGAEKIRGGQA